MTAEPEVATATAALAIAVTSMLFNICHMMGMECPRLLTLGAITISMVLIFELVAHAISP